MIMKAMLDSCLEFLLPRGCVLCGSPLPPELPWPLCGDCRASLRPWEGERCECCGLPLISELGRCMRCRGAQRAFDCAFPLFSYAGPVRDLIAEYKKNRRRSLAPYFALLFARAIEDRWPGWTVVPVPPRPARARDWDQVEEIARLLEARGIDVCRILERGHNSSQQKKLGRSERGDNAKKSYTLKPGATSPQRALLIDDVITTSATLDACALALRSGAAVRVEALVLAAD